MSVYGGGRDAGSFSDLLPIGGDHAALGMQADGRIDDPLSRLLDGPLARGHLIAAGHQVAL